MNKIIIAALIAIAGTSSAFADRAQSFGPERSAKEAPIVSSQTVSAEAKSSGRTALHEQGVKEAGTVADLRSVSSFTASDWTTRIRI